MIRAFQNVILAMPLLELQMNNAEQNFYDLPSSYIVFMTYTSLKENAKSCIITPWTFGAI